MKKAIRLRQTGAAAVAQMLDSAAAITADSMILLRLLHLKEHALRCRMRSISALRTDRALLHMEKRLLETVSCADPAEILPMLEKIETMLFEREQPRRASRRDDLAKAKRMLFAQWRQQATQIDLWTARMDALAESGAGLEGPSAQMNREQFETCARRLQSARRAFAQTWSALKAMDSVLLMQGEEESLRRLEQIYRDHLPDPDAFREDVWRTEIRSDLLDEKMNAIIGAKNNFEIHRDSRDHSPQPPLSTSENNNTSKPEIRSEIHDDELQKYPRQSDEGIPQNVLCRAECI